MATTRIRDGFEGGSDNQLKVNNDGSINIGSATVVGGDIVPAGLRIAGRITTLEVSTTPVELPAIPLVNRNAMSVTNLSNTTLYIGFSPTVTADSIVGTTSGWELGPFEGFNIDVQGSIPIYGVVASGTIIVKVMELS